MSSSSSSLLYAYDAFDVDVRALKVVLDLDVGIRVLEEPWTAILGIFSCHRLRRSLGRPS